SQCEAISGCNGRTNGCISVELTSDFSYHGDAGKITSEYSAVPAIRKSKLINKSSLPVGASSRHLISSGRMLSESSFNNPFVAPNKCFTKYSWPLPELEIKFALQTIK